MSRQLTGDEVAQYMLKKAETISLVQYNSSDIPYLSMESLRTRVFTRKKASPTHSSFKFTYHSTCAQLINEFGDPGLLLVKPEDVEREIPAQRRRWKKAPVFRTDVDPSARITCPADKFNGPILLSVKTLLEAGIIPGFSIIGMNLETFNSKFSDYGLVAKETETGISLF